MAITLGNFTSAFGGSGGTSAAIDTTGATLLVAALSALSPGISDSKGNTWTPLSAVSPSQTVQLFYVANPVVGTGHTFTCSGSFVSMVVRAYNGVATTTPFDQQNGSAASGTTVSPGSVTPSQDGELLVAACGILSPSAAPTVDSGFTTPSNYVNNSPGVNFGVAFSEQVQTTATARNPTFTGDSGSLDGCVIATFKATAGSQIAGTATGAATVTGALHGEGSLAGTSVGAASVVGTLSAQGQMTGIAHGVAVVSATLGAIGKLIGSAHGSAFVSGALDQHPAPPATDQDFYYGYKPGVPFPYRYQPGTPFIYRYRKSD